MAYDYIATFWDYQNEIIITVVVKNMYKKTLYKLGNYGIHLPVVAMVSHHVILQL